LSWGGVKISIMAKAQEWLDSNYPNKEGVEKITFNLDKYFHYRQPTDLELEGELVVTDYPNLKQLKIVRTRLTSIKIINCPQLNELFCANNLLTNVILPSELGELEMINLSQNNITQDLSLFSKFTNLRELVIGYNDFCGSLEPLKNLRKLELLAITDTDIDSGLEYLPDSCASRFFCVCEEHYFSFCKRPESRSKILEAQLAPYNGLLSDWRKDNQELITKARLTGLTREQQLVELNSILAKQLLKAQTDLQNKEAELVNLRKQLEAKIEIPPKN